MNIRIIALFALLCMAAIQTALQAAAETPGTNSENAPAAAAASPSWLLYSNGIYYKNLAVEKPQTPEGSVNLKKALEFFEAAAQSGAALDLVYYQMSECYYYLFDLGNSIEYAKKSIALNNTSIQPYNRLFNIYMRMKNYTAAADILESYLAVDPGNIYVQNHLAEHYYNNLRDVDRAIAAYNRVIALSQQEAVEDYFLENALYNLGYIYFERGDFEKAISLFRETLQVNKNNLNALYMLAALLMEDGKLDEAEYHARAYYAKSTENAAINAILGRVLYVKNSPEAARYLSRAGESKSMDGRLARALYQEILKRDDDAESVLEAAVKIRPKLPSPHIALGKINERRTDAEKAFNSFLTAGVLLYQGGMFTEAAYYLQRAGRIKANTAGVHYYLGRVYEDAQKLSLAIVNYRKAQDLSPSNDLIIHIGYLYGARGDYDRAMAYFARASQLDPENSKPHFFSCLVSLWNKNYVRAESDIRKALSLGDENETYYFYLAMATEKMDKFDETVRSLEKAIEHDPLSARALNFLGYIYAERNINIDRSHSLILQALELEPGNGAFIDSLGWVLYRQGRYQEALEKLLEAEKILSENKAPDPVVYDHIGDTHLKLGDPSRAVEYWKKALEFEKNDAILKKIKDHEQ
jgi:tetratricopeptide (TPR) repeat protein